MIVGERPAQITWLHPPCTCSQFRLAFDQNDDLLTTLDLYCIKDEVETKVCNIAEIKARIESMNWVKATQNEKIRELYLLLCTPKTFSNFTEKNTKDKAMDIFFETFTPILRESLITDY